MDLEVVHNKLRFYIDKFKNDWYPPEHLDSVIDDAQLELFTELQPAYGATQKLMDSLHRFKEKFTFTNAGTPAGILTLPQNYLHLLAIETVVVDLGHTLYLPVELLNEAQISTRKSSQLIPLSVKTPVCLLERDVFGKTLVHMYPELPSVGTAYYLRRPQAPKFVYSMGAPPNQRVMTYNLGMSFQLEWNDPSIEKIIYKSLTLLGINLKDAEAMQMGDVKDKAVA